MTWNEQIQVEELLQFAAGNPWRPHYPTPLVRRFLEELTSGPHLVFDLQDSAGRVSTAVLLDRVKNPANDACLEILGMRADADASRVVKKFIERVQQVQLGNRTGFQFAVSETSPVDSQMLIELGMTPYYDIYEMRRPSVGPPAGDSPLEIQPAVADDAGAVYGVLCAAFAGSPDTSISEPEEWRNAFLTSAKAHYYVWKSDGRILGFANLAEDVEAQEAEIRSLGVLTELRGKGIGAELLQHCLREAARLGYLKSRLSVAVTNDRALALYLRAGFATAERFRCFRQEF